MSSKVPSETGGWTFLTNYAHVLVCLIDDPAMRIRDIASEVGITERAAHRILDQLEAAGFVERAREGRCNTYTIDTDRALRHPVEEECTIGQLLSPVLKARRQARKKRAG